MARPKTDPKKPTAAKSGAGGRKLKVFEATLGFYDTVVAAPSQAAALRAWGSHQNLFADGVARLSEDVRATKAALSHPETVLRRAIGTKDPFSLTPGAPNIPDLPHPRKRATAAEKKARPSVDRSALNAAEAALATLEADHRAEVDALEERRRALALQQADAAEHFEEARARARERVEREREAYVKAGGRLDRR